MDNPNWIRGSCYTNLDKYAREQWPDRFVAVPLRDQRVTSSNMKQLWVANVEYSMTKEGEPRIRVELYNKFGVP